jgi:hypothetical protein
MPKRIALCLATLLAGVLGLPTPVRAQTASATIAGTVVDESTAAVPGVLVSVVNLTTGLRRSATTGAQGSFVVPLLPPGRYSLTAQRAGFAAADIPEIVLNVGDALDVRLLLKVAGIDALVSVTAQPPRVSTSPAVGTVVDRQFVENIPLNGRGFQSLITMTPGVVLTTASSTSPGQFSVNGQRSDANYFMVDGVSANVGVQPTAGLGPAGAGAAPGLSAQGGTNSLVSVDALQEFKIQSSSYAPEFGRTPGGQISMVTRSGTNQVHGSLFEYFRTDALDSTDYFVTRQHLAKPKEQQHDFGGVFGGPLQRDRMFVFVSYEGLRLDQPKSAVMDVPSLASRLAAPDVMKPIFAAFPLPNGPDTANGLAQFSASYADPSTLDAASVRVDRTFGPALTVSGRYNYAPSEGSSRLGSFGAASANTIGFVHNSLQTFTMGATWLIGPSLSNDVRANWSRNAGTNFQQLDAFAGAVVPPAAMLHPAVLPPQSVFRVNFGPANVFFDEGPNAANVQRQINVVDALVMTKGRHQVKAGFDYRRLLPIYDPVDYVQEYTFDGVAGATAGTAFVLTAASSTHNRSSHATNLSTYAQDVWSPTAALTLTYGVRWEINPPPGLNDSDEALTLTTADPAAIALAPPGTPMYRTTYGNVAPRLGAAYRLRDTPGRELVLRGGWGIFFDLASPAVLNNLSQTFPFTAIRFFDNVALPADPALLAVPTIAPGAPADFLVAADPNLKLPYTHEWNASVEQAFGTANTVTVSYVGAVGRRLLVQERVFNPTPQFQVVNLGTNRGHSHYQSLQVKYARRLSRGLQALASYTLARSMDNISSDAIQVLPLFRNDPDQEWGPSGFDVRHTVTGGMTFQVPASARGPVWRAITGGWSVDAVFSARSALPVNVVTGTAPFGVSNALRPDVVPGAPLYVDDAAVPGGRRFNRAAFVAPPVDAGGTPLRQGTLERNALRGFAMSQLDLAVRRDIPVRRGAHVQLSAEAFNLFNQTSFGPPVNTLASGLFGQTTRVLSSSFGAAGITGGGLSPLYQVGGPRSIQLAAKLQF